MALKESSKTLLFLGVALLSVATSVAAYFLMKPPDPEGFDKVGKEFYPDFNDPQEAISLQIVSADENGRIQQFEMKEQYPGKWVIATHDNYPVEGRERLAKTAAAVIGIKRNALKTRRADEHENYGVLDPLDESVVRETASPEGLGSRLILKAKDGRTLVDLIIGKPVEGQPGQFYVRRPEEKEVYLSEVEIDLSTSLGDWIEADLLKLDPINLIVIEIRKSSIDEQKSIEQNRTVLAHQDVSILTRPSGTLPWELEGLDPKTEVLDQSFMNSLVKVLDELRIVDALPKQLGLRADLSIDLEFLQKNYGKNFDQFIWDLESKLVPMGFFLAPADKGKFQVLSKEGQVLAKTNTGIIYELHFGDLAQGDDLNLQSGFQNQRYLFITVRFDESLIPQPTEPVKPQKPENLPSQTDPELKTPEQFAYEQQMSQYEAQKDLYEQELTSYQGKVTQGKELAQELNDRFSDWFYVISADSFEKLRLSRKSLVQVRPQVQEPPARLPIEAPRPQ